MTAYEVAVRAGATLGEGPAWDPVSGRLIWLDILGARVHTYDPSTGRRTVRTTDQHIGAAKPRAGGGLVLNLRDGVGLLDPDGTFAGCAASRCPAAAGTTRRWHPTAPSGRAPCGTTRRPVAARCPG